MQILLIRHGQSEADLLDVHEGRADFPLTQLGHEQAKKMAERVQAEFPPDFIWASTLQRASQTASYLAEAVGCPIEYIPELMEKNNGDLAGRPHAEVEYPWNLLPHEKMGTSGESEIEFRSRAEHIFSRLRTECQANGHSRIAIVSHGGMITRLLDSFIGMPFTHNMWFDTRDTGIHFLETNKIGNVIRFMNCTKHLE